MGYKILLPEDITEPGKLYLKERGYEIIAMEDPTEESICQAVKCCSGMVSRTIKCSRKIMTAGKMLKVIGSHGVGTEKIDLTAATELGIQVTNTPCANTNSVAEHTLALILACAKHLVYLDEETRRGNFAARNIVKSMELEGKTLGIVGCGRIGKLVAKKAALGLGMKVIGEDPYLSDNQWPSYIQRKKTLDDLLREADVVSIHVPLTKETTNMFNALTLKLMKANSIIVNCGRGGVINEEELYAALVSYKIAGAGLDVFMQEPVNRNNPLLSLENVVVSPHNAGLSTQAMDQTGLDAVKGIDEVLSGKKPTWPVNKI